MADPRQLDSKKDKAKTAAPAMPKPPVQTDTLTKKEILEKLTHAIPALKEKVSENDLTAAPDLLQSNFAFVLRAIAFLVKAQDNTSLLIIVEPENLLNLLNADTFYAWQLEETTQAMTNNAARAAFVEKYFLYFGKNILWKPFLDELARYEENSQLEMLVFDHDLDNYVKAFTAQVVTIDYARYHIGLPDYAVIISGKPIRIRESQGKNEFSTNAEGDMYLPLFVDVFDTKEENLSNFRISVVHECGHHLWNTFEINVHPEAFDYEAFGLEFLGYDDKERKVSVRKRGEKDSYEVTELSGLCALAPFPMLLHTLHNIVDDARVDRNNMARFESIREDYESDIRKLLDMRAKKPRQSEIPNISKYLDATMDYVYFGKTEVELSPEQQEKFEAIKKALDLDAEDSSTGSLNKAMRVYRILEADAQKAAEQCKAMKPKSARGQSGTRMKGIVKLTSKAPEKPQADGAPARPKGNSQPGKGDPKGSDHQKFNYDEWVDRGFKKDALTVTEIRVDSAEAIDISIAEKERLKRIFQKYAPRQGVYERGLEEGEIDDELYAAWFEAYQAGKIEEKRFHSQVVYEERDVATAILIDFSGSTRGVLPHILRAAGTLSEVSQILHDPLLVAGLSEQAGSEFYILKDWHDRNVRLATCGGGGTPLAGPMRHLTHKMDSPLIRTKGFKQAFVFTDGDANVGEQPVEDMRMAVKEAWAKQRIKTFMIGIAIDEEHSKKVEFFLQKIVGPGNYLLLQTNELGRLNVFFERYYRKLVNKIL